jgi:hypothetical protein
MEGSLVPISKVDRGLPILVLEPAKGVLKLILAHKLAEFWLFCWQRVCLNLY